MPTLAVLLAAGGATWQAHGSTNAVDWLPYGIVTLLVLAVVLVSAPVRPPSAGLVGVAALAGLACWSFVSHWWSASPALARDEALLTLVYAAALAVPLFSLRTPAGRLAALGLVGLFSTAIAAGVAVELITVEHPGSKFVEGRLDDPISYVNAQAAVFLIGWWALIALAAHRRVSVWLRAVALGGAALVGAAATAASARIAVTPRTTLPAIARAPADSSTRRSAVP